MGAGGTLGTGGSEQGRGASTLAAFLVLALATAAALVLYLGSLIARGLLIWLLVDLTFTPGTAREAEGAPLGVASPFG